HGMWHPWRDLAALKLLKPDIILFVGDFGEEQVQLVQQVAAVKGMMSAVGAQVEVAVILGNHDAWFHMFSLGSLHVGYGRVDLPQWRLSIVGARPFSYGPSSWAKSFYRARCGVRTMNASTAKITETIRAAPESHSVVVLAHNGPAGLGSHPWDICGKDFPSKGLPPGGDFGDEDLARAIAAALEDGRHMPLVVFGHMHRDLFPFNYRSRSNRPSTPHIAPTLQGEPVTQRRMAAVLLHPASPPLPSSPSPLAAATLPAERATMAAAAALSMPAAAGSTPLAAPSNSSDSTHTTAHATTQASTHTSTHATTQASTLATNHTVFLNAAVVPRIVSLDEEHFTRTSGPGLAVYPALGSEPLDPTPGLLPSYWRGMGENWGAGGEEADSGPEGVTAGVCRGMKELGMGGARDARGGGEVQVAVQAGCVGGGAPPAEMVSQQVEDARSVTGVADRDGELCGEVCGTKGGGETGGAAEAVVWEDEVRWEGDDGVAVGEAMGGRDAGAAPSLHHFVLAHLAVQETVVAAAADSGREGQCVDGDPSRWVCVGAEDVWVKVDERTGGGERRGMVACLHRKGRR
ncbi:unnamed protein product, partial [Closterium sp. Yama58-4]